MRKRIELWDRDEYHFPGAGGFVPFLMAELHEDGAVHPAMIVIPGGGFILMSPGEADGAAEKFYGMGYNTFVLVYTNNVTLDKPMIHQALRDASRAVRLLRAESGSLGIDPQRISAVGFSGGGHLAASMAVLYDLPELAESGKYGEYSNRLNAAVLVYALVTGGEYTCPGAYDMLLGPDASEEERALHSLERQVKENSVPMYILQGTSDFMVPAQNALMMASACAEKNVAYELNLLLGCFHGFAVTGFDRKYAIASRYVFEQLYETVEAMSPEEFAGYGELFSGLRQGMDYSEFAETVESTTMGNLWGTGLHVDMSTVREAVAATGGNMSYVTQKNPSADGWWIRADNWIRLVTGQDCP